MLIVDADIVPTTLPTALMESRHGAELSAALVDGKLICIIFVNFDYGVIKKCLKLFDAEFKSLALGPSKCGPQSGALKVGPSKCDPQNGALKIGPSKLVPQNGAHLRQRGSHNSPR